MSDLEIEPKKESRADFRYQPLCKPLIDVMCLPKDQKEREVFSGVMTHYIDTRYGSD